MSISVSVSVFSLFLFRSISKSFLPGEWLSHESEPLSADLHALLCGQAAHRVPQVLLDVSSFNQSLYMIAYNPWSLLVQN